MKATDSSLFVRRGVSCATKMMFVKLTVGHNRNIFMFVSAREDLTKLQKLMFTMHVSIGQFKEVHFTYNKCIDIQNG